MAEVVHPTPRNLHICMSGQETWRREAKRVQRARMGDDVGSTEEQPKIAVVDCVYVTSARNSERK